MGSLVADKLWKEYAAGQHQEELRMNSATRNTPAGIDSGGSHADSFMNKAASAEPAVHWEREVRSTALQQAQMDGSNSISKLKSAVETVEQLQHQVGGMVRSGIVPVTGMHTKISMWQHGRLAKGWPLVEN